MRSFATLSESGSVGDSAILRRIRVGYFLGYDFFDIVRVNRRLRGVAIVLVVTLMMIGVSSCAEPLHAQFNSRRSAGHAVPIERMLVMTAISNVGLEGVTYRVFESVLRAKLRQCGIRSRILQSNPLELDAATHVSESADELRPNAMMMVKGISGQHVIDRSRLYLDLKLFDIASARVLWIAKLAFDVDSNGVWFEDSAAGNRLATGIVSQLRDDRVIAGCPASWPGSSRPNNEIE